MTTPGHTPAELEALVERQLDDALDAGHVIRNIDGWRRDCRERTLANEQSKPGYIHRITLALEAKAKGERITRCREVRGSHQVDHVYDPQGTAPPPDWWNEDAAKKAENAYRERLGLEPYR